MLLKMINHKINKKGWIKIVEALTAILLIAGVVLIAIQQSRGTKEDIFQRVHNDQIAILRDIQLNNSLRADVIDPTKTPPIEWSSVDFPASIKSRIVAKTPNYLNCSAKICVPEDVCLLTDKYDKTIYSESVIITAVNNNYNPRQLKLFCLTK